MAIGDKIYFADKETLDAAKANTDGILAKMTDPTSPFTDVKRYGVKINHADSNPKTRVTYLYDAVGLTPAAMNFTTGVFSYGDWAAKWFNADCYPVMLKYDGTEDYKLSPGDYTKKEDGTTSSAVNDLLYAGNAMVAHPTTWISQYEIGDDEYIILCNVRYDSSYHAYAHTRADGTIMDKLYLPAYRGSSDGTRLRSISGQQPLYSKTAAQEVALANANGSNWSIKSWAHRNLVNCLLTVMFKTDDVPSVMGNGNLNYQESLTPTMGVMANGSLDDKGMFWGTNDNTHNVKVFGMESWWANQWDRCLGLMLVGGRVKAKMTPPYNLTGAGYDDVGISFTAVLEGYAKYAKMSKYGRITKAIGGSASTYMCDYFYVDPAVTAVALVGGAVNNGPYTGPWNVYLFISAGRASWGIGASLSCEQPAA